MKARALRFPAVHESEIIPGWRQIRHGRNHRAPQTHTEERIYRDESTMPDDEDQEELTCEPSPLPLR